VGHVHVDATIRGRRLASGRTVRLPTALGGIRIEGREAATDEAISSRRSRAAESPC